MFYSPVVRSRYVGLGFACAFDVLMIGYDVTVVDRAVDHIGVGMSRSRGSSDQDGLYVVVCNEVMIDFNKDMFGCSFDVSETIIGSRSSCARV